MKRVDLFVIDGQNDFCASGNEPNDWPTPFGGKRQGALYVTGADQEAIFVAEMIQRLRDGKSHKISKIHPSLDQHQLNDGSHNTSWKDAAGNSPAPFTIVSHADVASQRLVPRFSRAVWKGKMISSVQWGMNYTEALEKEGRAPLCLWPVHCEIGGWGSAIYHPLAKAYDDWCLATNGWIDYISKGQWPFSEHYSAFRADVIDPTRPETQMNSAVVEDASQADIICWAGWAGSHCLRYTALDAADYFGQGTTEFMKKSVFLSDACAAVPDIPGATVKFSEWRAEFLNEVKKRGATIMTTKEFLA